MVQNLSICSISEGEVELKFNHACNLAHDHEDADDDNAEKFCFHF